VLRQGMVFFSLSFPFLLKDKTKVMGRFVIYAYTVCQISNKDHRSLWMRIANSTWNDFLSLKISQVGREQHVVPLDRLYTGVAKGKIDIKYYSKTTGCDVSLLQSCIDWRWNPHIPLLCAYIGCCLVFDFCCFNS
jgi:hypothetical protein